MDLGLIHLKITLCFIFEAIVAGDASKGKLGREGNGEVREGNGKYKVLRRDGSLMLFKF